MKTLHKLKNFKFFVFLILTFHLSSTNLFSQENCSNSECVCLMTFEVTPQNNVGATINVWTTTWSQGFPEPCSQITIPPGSAGTTLYFPFIIDAGEWFWVELLNPLNPSLEVVINGCGRKDKHEMGGGGSPPYTFRIGTSTRRECEDLECDEELTSLTTQVFLCEDEATNTYFYQGYFDAGAEGIQGLNFCSDDITVTSGGSFNGTVIPSGQYLEIQGFLVLDQPFTEICFELGICVNGEECRGSFCLEPEDILTDCNECDFDSKLEVTLSEIPGNSCVIYNPYEATVDIEIEGLDPNTAYNIGIYQDFGVSQTNGICYTGPFMQLTSDAQGNIVQSGIVFNWDAYSFEFICLSLNVSNTVTGEACSEHFCFSIEDVIMLMDNTGNALIDGNSNSTFVNSLAANKGETLKITEEENGLSIFTYFNEAGKKDRIIHVEENTNVLDSAFDLENSNANVSSTIRFYPNPANTQVTFTSTFSDQTEVMIFSSNGALLNQFIVNGDSQKNINVENLSEGLYFIESRNLNTQEQTVEKLIIRK